MKAGALTELAIPRLELLRGRRVADDRVDAHADLLHLLEVGVLERAQHAFGRPLLGREHHDLAPHPARDVGPAVPGQVLLGEHARLHGGEVLEPALLPPGRRHVREPLRVGWPVVAHVDGGRRALEDVELCAGAGELGHALHGGGAGADDRDPLVLELLHRRAGRITARISIVPPARVKGVTTKALDP